MTATKEATHDVPVGAIFEWSWGYDQTNVDYYQVVGVTRTAVKVRPIGSKTVPGSDGFMSCTVRPAVDHFTSDEIETKRVKRSSESGQYYLAKPYGWCSVVPADSSTYSSWYA